MEPLKTSAPPQPSRNPNHGWHKYPQLPASDRNSELVPQPLFSTRSIPPPHVLHVTVHELPQPSPSPSSAVPSSPTASVRSFNSSLSATTTTSTDSSHSSQSRFSTYYFPLPDTDCWASEQLLVPKHSLRRKPRPKKGTLRSLRAKESEACLQRCYDQQLDAYLSGNLFRGRKWEGGLSTVGEE